MKLHPDDIEIEYQHVEEERQERGAIPRIHYDALSHVQLTPEQVEQARLFEEKWNERGVPSSPSAMAARFYLGMSLRHLQDQQGCPRDVLLEYAKAILDVDYDTLVSERG